MPMPVVVANLVARFTADTTQAHLATKKLETAITSSAQRMTASAGVLGTGLSKLHVGLGVAAIGAYKMAKASSDLNEAANYSQVIFGSASDRIEEYAKNAEKIGQSATQAIQGAAFFGTLFTNIGKSADAAATMSIRMSQLASDLASVANSSADEAIIALQAGLRGEEMPLRRFGVQLQDAVLRQRALSMGLVETTSQVLPPAIRTQAAYAEILSQTTKQQGDAERTAGSMANQMRQLKANVTNAAASLGGELEPALTAVIRAMNTGINAAESYVDHLGRTAKGVRSFLSGEGFDVPGPTLEPQFGAVSRAMKASIEDVTLALGKQKSAVNGLMDSYRYLLARADALAAVEDARDALADAQTAGARAAADATRARADAQRSAADAAERLADAQARLNELNSRDIGLLQRRADLEAKRAAHNAAAAALAIAKAEDNLQRARDRGESPRVLAEAEENLADAKLRQEEAVMGAADAAKAAADVQKNAAKEVADADRAVRDAKDAVVDANRRVAEAAALASEAGKNGARDVERAERDLRQAVLDLTDTFGESRTAQLRGLNELVTKWGDLKGIVDDTRAAMGIIPAAGNRATQPGDLGVGRGLPPNPGAPDLTGVGGILAGMLPGSNTNVFQGDINVHLPEGSSDAQVQAFLQAMADAQRQQNVTGPSRIPTGPGSAIS